MTVRQVRRFEGSQRGQPLYQYTFTLSDTALVAADLSDPARIHRRVLSLFHDQRLDGHARATYEVLYRVDPGPVLIVQAAIRPRTSRLPSGYAVRVHRDTLDWYPYIEARDQFGFALFANPTRRIRADRADRLAGKIVELRSEPERRAWLERRAAALGFYVDDVQVSAPERLSGREARSVTHVGVWFHGILTVTDGERFRNTLRQGIGRGKAHGLGLMTLTPPTWESRFQEPVAPQPESGPTG